MFSQSQPQYLVFDNETIINLANVKFIENHNDEKIKVHFTDKSEITINGNLFKDIKKTIINQ